MHKFWRMAPSFKLAGREESVRAALVQTGLFDSQWYADTYPDLADWPGGLLEHFVLHGDKESRSPHPLFDVQWYLDTYPDVAAQGGSPLLHLLRYGFAEGRDPNPYFSTRYYLSNNPSANSGWSNPLSHFLSFWAPSRLNDARRPLAEQSLDDVCNPHPMFDCRWYLTRYGANVPDTLDPLSFHLAEGRFRHFDPHPLIDSRWYQDAYGALDGKTCALEHYLSSPYGEIRCPSPLFDRQWYVDTYADLIDRSIDPLIDYVLSGRFAGRLPHPMFATDWYIKKNPDAAEYPGGALCHFRDFGARQGLDPHPLFSTSYFISCHREAAKYPCGPAAYYLLRGREEVLQPHPMFDPRWYVACNPEAKEKGVTPLVHLLGYGVWRNRDPHPLFDTEWYVHHYPQSRQPFVHPLVHYLEVGSAIGHWPTNFFDPAYYALRYPQSAGMDPLIHFATSGLENGYTPNEDAKEIFEGVPVPDVYNAQGLRFSRYVRAIGLVSRLVLACDAVKRDPDSYAYYLRCLTAAGKPRRRAVDYTVPPVVSVILPTYNGLHFTLACIDSIARFRPNVSFEVIVADNVSTDDTEKVMKRRRDIRYVRHPENLGFLRSCNRAARMARGEFVFLLNNDTLVAPGWLDELYSQFCNSENVGLVGSKLIYPDGRLQEAGGIIWKDGSAWNYGKFQDPGHPEFNYVRETDYISGAAIMLPKRLWDEIGGFDEMYVPSYCEDSDLALRVRSLGYSVLYCPHSVVSHFEGMTQGRDTSSGVKSFQVSNTEKLLARWKSMIGTYQPNGQDLHIAKDRGYFKRALFLDNCTPNTREDAGSVTALNIMLLFKSRGYQVTFIPRDNLLYMNDLTKTIQSEGIEVIYGHHTMSVSDHLKVFGSRYDVVMLVRPDSFINHIDDIRNYCANSKIIYHTCDLHYLRFLREYEISGEEERLRLSRDIKVIEYDALRAAHASIVHSTAEEEIIRKERAGVKNVHVFGWAIPVPGASKTFDERSGAIFVGGFNHGPNVDAVIFFVREVLPLIWKKAPDFIFHIVGSKVPQEIDELAGPCVIVHGFVENLDPLLQQARVAVAPLRYGAGIKGKIATAMAAGLPNVVTSIGAEGMNLVDGKHCLIADRPTDFAAAVLRLNNDRGLWSSLSHASEVYANENYGTDAAGAIFDNILLSVGEKAEIRTRLKLASPAGVREEGAWPQALLPVKTIRDQRDWTKFQSSSTAERMRERDRYARIKLHDNPEKGFPGYSVVKGQWVVFTAENVSIDAKEESLREKLVCPLSGMCNSDRLLASVAMAAGLTAGKNSAIYVVSGSKGLRKWASGLNLGFEAYSNADAIICDFGCKFEISGLGKLSRLVAKGGTLIASLASVKSGFDAMELLRNDGWSDVLIDIYHSTDYGHLGDDLFVLRASR